LLKFSSKVNLVLSRKNSCGCVLKQKRYYLKNRTILKLNWF
jgi:hypothetical protein